MWLCDAARCMTTEHPELTDFSQIHSFIVVDEQHFTVGKSCGSLELLKVLFFATGIYFHEGKVLSKGLVLHHKLLQQLVRPVGLGGATGNGMLHVGKVLTQRCQYLRRIVKKTNVFPRFRCFFLSDLIEFWSPQCIIQIPHHEFRCMRQGFQMFPIQRRR